ncbi:MAG: hypothetical protein KGQ95_01815 [Acidobacteria bacterium]|nr:hypothetical protein [Acidobacteriota bacterium]
MKRQIAAGSLIALSTIALAGCFGDDSSTPATTTEAAPATTTEAAPPATTTEAAPPATTTAAAAPSSGGPNLTAPSGAQQLESDSKSGAQYTRYSISGTAASAVTSDYQSQLESQGYNITNSGGSGGGWGKWGGSEAGVSGNNGSTWVDVQAGGQSGGPTYFEVCVGPSNTSVQDCEDASDGPDDNSNSSK